MWYVIQTMSGQEQACMELCQKRLEKGSCQDMFVPRYIAKRHYQKGWHDKEMVLFPGYFFVDTDEIGTIVEVLHGIPQFSRVLKSAGEVAPVTREEQEFLEDLMDEDHVVRHSEGFLIGDQVYIMDGPLRNWKGRIRKVDRHRRIAYLDVDLFGRMTPMEVGFSAVARVTEEEFQAILDRNREITKEDVISDEKWEFHRISDRHSNGTLSNEMLSIGIHSNEKNFNGKKVRIITGIFQGMAGELIYVDEEKDEWAVRLPLFGEEPSRVVFRRKEITL